MWQGGERFLPQSPVDIVNLKNDSWLFSYMAKAPQLGRKTRNQREGGKLAIISFDEFR